EALPLEQLHHEVRAAVGEVAKIEHVDDVGVADPGRGTRLTHELLRRVGIAGERFRAQHLERVAPTEHDALDAEHRAHAALAEQLHDPVVADRVTDQALGGVGHRLGPMLRHYHHIGAQLVAGAHRDDDLSFAIATAHRHYRAARVARGEIEV